MQEALRNKKQQQKGGAAAAAAAAVPSTKPTAAAIAGAGKRYLILTYVVEFDRCVTKEIGKNVY